MRLHRLRMQAFGPYPGSHEIDFDSLHAAGLHLIHGPTGAGKTSILDAICFALFGEVPGARKGLGGPVCALASLEMRPEIELEATIAGRRVRLLRRPTYERPKKRGTGTVTEKASVHLWTHTGAGWQEESSRVQEVQTFIDTELGLSLQQFAQVILLPQGAFAEFLHAEPDQRDTVLRRLFDIDSFTGLEQWFEDERGRARAQVEELAGPVQRADVRIDQLVGELQGWVDREWPASLPADRVASTQVLTQVVRTAATESAVAADDAAARLRAAHQEVVTAQRLLDLRGRAQSAHDELEDLRSPERAALRTSARAEVAAAERAEKAAPAIARATRARAEAEAAAELAQRRRPSTVPEEITPQAAVDRAALAADAVSRLGTVISPASREAAAAIEHATAVIRDRGAQARAVELADRTRADLEGTRAKQTALTESAAQAPGLREQVNAADLAIREVDSWSQALARSAAARTHHEGSLEATNAAHALHESLRARRVQALAAGLAADLKEGVPCAVCGSPEHPDPALLTVEEAAEHGPAVSDTEVRAAFDAEERARADLAQAQSAHAAAEATASAIGERARAAVTAAVPDGALGDAPTPAVIADLAQFAEQVREQLATATTAAQEHEAAQARISTLDATLAEASTSAENARTSAGFAETALRRSWQELGSWDASVSDGMAEHAQHCGCLPSVQPDPLPQLPEELPADEGTVPGLLSAWQRSVETAVATLQTSHQRFITQLGAWAEADRAHRAALHQHESARSELREALSAHGFADLEAALAAHRDDERVTELRQALSQDEQRQAVAHATLAEPDVIAALALPAPDLDAVTALQATADQRERTLRAESEQLDRLAVSLGSAVAELQAAQAKAKPAQERHEQVQALSELLRGRAGTRRRMALSSYVLAARLETVVAIANQRLEPMTEGRYRLKHVDGAGSHGRRGGLGLLICDDWTGTQRSTRSLSGGETFMAALALALALAEAIQEDAGGRPLETLFVDEGFGSLDEESLEQVLTVLDDLRAGGRSVGVVSHVAELKHRIPAQIEVFKAETGSSLTVRLPAQAAIA
ncbi:AAA family ATPase [Dermacoccaceae bacterium W4C1]